MAGTSLINIGISGLRTQQAALATTGHNITNANTPGYSRQRVDVVPQRPQLLGVGFLGAGARLDAISRVVSDYAIAQVRSDTALASEVESFLAQVGQVDSLLANESTGLVPALETFFGSLEAASSDPSSLPARQLVLSETSKLADRFHAMFDRLESQARSLDDLAESAVGRISELAAGIADLNDRIVAARGSSVTSRPNDLLDQRDELLRRLAEIVGVATVPQSDGQINVFIGKGQPLVLGRVPTPMNVLDNGDIVLGDPAGGVAQVVTGAITGGELGGVLAFRTGVLDTAMNQLGRIALGVAERVNAQHHKGITLDGVLGDDLFADINSPANAAVRVVGLISAPGSAASMHVAIDDIGGLTISGYELRISPLDGASYELVRRNDLVVVRHGQLTPGVQQTIAVDGFRLTIESSDLRAGDRYLIQPTRTGARDIARVIDAARDLALASPVSVATGLGNRGTAIARAGDVLDITHPIFATPGQLSPPLLIRFTSDTTYDVLDASDAALPVDLVPPRRNLPYVPGIVNALLPDELGQTLVAANGANAQSLPAAAQLVTGLVAVANAIGSETLALSGADPTTGQLLPAGSVAIVAGSSAKSIADQLAVLGGVGATAFTDLTIASLTNNGGGVPLAIAVNGQRFTGTDVSSLDALADAVNADSVLAGAGVTASSDGTRLILSSSRGDDLAVHLSGDAADGIVLLDASGDSLALNGAGAGTAAVVTGTQDVTAGFDFSVGGPYTFGLAVDGGPSAQVTLSGTYGSGAALVAGLQAATDLAVGGGRVVVGLGGGGEITLTSTASGANGRIEVSGAAAASPIDLSLGLTNAAATGEDQYRTTTIGGTVTVLLDPGYRLMSNAAAVGGNVFTATPPAVRADLGLQVTMTGQPRAGDTFRVDFTADGVSDNRNALELAALQNGRVLADGNTTLFDAYAELVEFVGSRTSEARIQQDAAQGLLAQSVAMRESVSGVNLDEEAGNLIKFEQAYNASARVIQVARDIFNVLFQMVA